MRSPLVLLLLAAGCAPAPILPARLPAPDPYLVPPPREEWAPVVKIYTPRRREWDQARYATEVASVASSVAVRAGPASAVVTLTGPEAAAEVAATFVCDRARFAGWRVALDAREVRVAADAWSFEALVPEDGEAWTVVPTADARRLLEEPGAAPLVSYTAGDAEEVESSLERQEAFIAGVLPFAGAAGVLGKDPHVLTLTTGTSVRTTAWLADEGRTLVLDWRHETRRRDAQADVLARDARGFTAVPVSLPRLITEEAEGRFVLRQDEALVLVRPAAGDDGELVLTVVGWAPVPWRP